MDKIDGRSEDNVILKDGTIVGRLDHIFKDIVNIKEAQIFQKEKGKIQLRIVKNDQYKTEDENLIIEGIKNYLREIEIELVYLNEIPKTNNNKLRFVISEIGKKVN